MIVELAKLGAIGLGILLAVYAYNLQKTLQQHKTPDARSIRMVYIFQAFCLSLFLVGSVAEYEKSADRTQVKVLTEQVATLTEAKSDKDNEIGKRDTEIAALRARLDQNIASTTDLTGRLASANAEIDGLHQQVATWQETNKKSLTQIGDLGTQMTDLQAAYAKVADGKAAALQLASDLRGRFERSLVENTVLTNERSAIIRQAHEFATQVSAAMERTSAAGGTIQNAGVCAATAITARGILEPVFGGLNQIGARP